MIKELNEGIEFACTVVKGNLFFLTGAEFKLWLNDQTWTASFSSWHGLVHVPVKGIDVDLETQRHILDMDEWGTIEVVQEDKKL